MSTTVEAVEVDPSGLPIAAAHGVWKAPVLFGVFALLLAAIVGFKPADGDTTFRLATSTDFAQLPKLVVPANATAWVSVAILACATGAAASFAARRQRTPLWLIAAYCVVVMTGFLAWAVAGETLPVVGLLAGALALAVPLVFGALGGVLGERSGVVNIAIDGQLLFGAFGAALVGSLTGSALAALIAAMLAGALVALILGVFAITYHVDQVIVGVVLNVLVIGVTVFSEIPIIGPILFRQTVLVYLLYITVAVVTWALYRTRWGLRVRAVGEHPKAADTVGIKVVRTRYRTVLLAGLIAGAGGATYTLVAVSQFNREMTGGAGYIALAAVIFGKWDPIKATLAALLFGFATNLQNVLSVLGAPVPSQFMLMLPYVVTVFAVAGLVGRSRPPAADGIPYKSG